MADTGATSPGTMVDDDAIGTVAWSDVDYAKASDDNHATTGKYGVATQFHYLKATNFGFSIPEGATIDGIFVEIEGSAYYDGIGMNTVYPKYVQIVKSDGSIGAENKGNTVGWGSGDNYFEFGDVNDLWSEDWVYTDINDEDFGVVIAAYVTGGPDDMGMRVDHITITVYYSEAGVTNPKVKIAGTFETKVTKVKIGGNFVEKPMKVKVSGTFQ